MSLLEKMKLKKEQMQQQMQRGREKTGQMKAEKLRKQKQKAKYLEPGTFRYGLHYKQSVGDFMDDVRERRRQKRK